jgi:ribosome maturation factor RimP
VTAIEPILGSLGLDLYDIELIGTAGKSRALRVLVDRADADPETHVDLDAVTEATRAVSTELDRLADSSGPVPGVLRGPYTLEVSSPGLERPLRSAAHWRGAVGSEASVKTSVRESGTAGDTVRRHGVVLAADDEGVDLEIDGNREHVAYADIVQARTVFEWGAQAKPSAGTGKRSQSKREKVTE